MIIAHLTPEPLVAFFALAEREEGGNFTVAPSFGVIAYILLLVAVIAIVIVVIVICVRRSRTSPGPDRSASPEREPTLRRP